MQSADYGSVCADVFDLFRTRIYANKKHAHVSACTGTMGLENPIGTVAPNRGTLYRASNESCYLEPVLRPVSISNGMAWSLDNRYMYYIDSPTKRVEKFDYDPLTGSIGR